MPIPRSIYLDYNATTPLDAGVREAMDPFLGRIFGNPSSVHHRGREARSRLDDARWQLAESWKCKPSEITFTSGGTESANTAILGAARLRRGRGRHLITTQTEHHAVLQAFAWLEEQEGFEVTRLRPDARGFFTVEQVVEALRADTILVSVIAANNETGVIQPVARIGKECAERGVLFHTDAVQWFGKLPFSGMAGFHADLVSVCGHKFHGPKGCGALFVKSPLLLPPLIMGGPQENERRAGTENVAGVVGLTHAFLKFVPTPVFNPEYLQPLQARIRLALESIPDLIVHTPESKSLPNTISFSVVGTDSIALMAALDLEGICASSGSACSAGSLTPSHVLRAMGLSELLSNALVRFSMGRETTELEIGYVEKVLPGVLATLRGRS